MYVCMELSVDENASNSNSKKENPKSKSKSIAENNITGTKLKAQRHTVKRERELTGIAELVKLFNV